MIYLVYIATESGTPIWRYHHPRMPTYILESIVGKDESIITGYASAIAELTSKVFGDRVQKMESKTYNLYHGYYELNGHKLLLLILSDVKDSEKAVWRVITKFLEDNKVGFLKLIEECSVIGKILGHLENEEKINGNAERECQIIYRKLERALHEELDKSLRIFRPLSERSNKTIMLGSTASFAVFLAMFFLTQHFNTSMGWLRNNQLGVLFTSIAVLVYLVPSIALGLIVGFRKGAFLAGFILGIFVTSFLIVYYLPYFTGWVYQWGLNPHIYFMLPVLIIALGGAIGVVSSWIAGLMIEDKTLVPAEEEVEFPKIE